MEIKANSKSTWGVPAGRDASAIMLHPYMRLGAAVIVRAIKDYQNDDILRSVDALAWWLSDGPVWLQMLDFYEGDNPDEVFLKIAGGDYVEGRQFTQSLE